MTQTIDHYVCWNADLARTLARDVGWKYVWHLRHGKGEAFYLVAKKRTARKLYAPNAKLLGKVEVGKE